VPLNLTGLYSLFEFLRLELYPRYPGSVVSMVARHVAAPPTLRRVRRTRYKISTGGTPAESSKNTKARATYPADQEAAAFTFAFPKFRGETTISARPMITNISTPYSRCARSLTMKNACMAIVAA
jgi:hypothetical protein